MGLEVRFRKTLGGAPGFAGLKVLTRTLTSAEILALNTSPVTLVEGSAGKILWPLFGAAVGRAGATAYATSSGNILVLISDYAALVTSDTFLITMQAGTNVGVSFGSAGPSGGTLLENLSGAPIVMSDDTANPTDGDGTLDVMVLYLEIEV